MMKLSLIICTYMRPAPLRTLLASVASQTVYPDEILVVDGSQNHETASMLAVESFKNLRYFLVGDADRGLTRQRNYGIARVSEDADIVAFLDDDTVLDPDYFAEILETYRKFPDALGVGGYIVNESAWAFAGEDYTPTVAEFFFDGWKRADGSRFILRKRLGLDTNLPPGFAPEFSNGRSIGFLPPSGKTYRVEQLMGGVSSFRKGVFKTFSFSHYFEGYGLYEDADFTLRVSKTGALYVNTAARLAHYHDASGRPNRYRYGKMVVRNGWYVWRVKHPSPGFNAKLKWHSIVLLLTAIRFTNIFSTAQRREALTEFAGRLTGWLSLIFDKPRENS
jgi:glycosyltransferase involved in cell wall biosynthesis